MIQWDKKTETESKEQIASDQIRGMEEAVKDFCRRLSKDTKNFEPKIFFEKLHEYITNDNRLLYTHITNYVFSLEKEEQFGIMQTNLDNVINYIFSKQFSCDFSWDESQSNVADPYDRTKRTVLKIWDHINLARRQYVLFHETDKEYERIVDKKMEVASAGLIKDMTAQLISLVAIFTALSFLVFGGISSLDNIFIGAKDIPVTKLMIVGIIWCFCIMNLVFVFIFYIAKITGLNIKSSQDVNANIVQNYPMVCWCNFVLITIFVFSCWAYYIKCEGFSNEAYLFLSAHSTLYCIAGTALIAWVIILVAKKLCQLSKWNKS